MNVFISSLMFWFVRGYTYGLKYECDRLSTDRRLTESNGQRSAMNDVMKRYCKLLLSVIKGEDEERVSRLQTAAWDFRTSTVRGLPVPVLVLGSMGIYIYTVSLLSGWVGLPVFYLYWGQANIPATHGMYIDYMLSTHRYTVIILVHLLSLVALHEDQLPAIQVLYSY